jgi:hypothetical protein
MGFLDWIKRGRSAWTNKVEAKPPIPVWQQEPYKDPSSGYLAQAFVGISEKGYHAGLAVIAPDGNAVTTWARPVQMMRLAFIEAQGGLSDLIESHAGKNAREQLPVPETTGRGYGIEVDRQWEFVPEFKGDLETARARIDSGQMPKEAQEHRALFAEWRQDHEMARERDATGKEPERRPIPSPETGKSKTAPTPPKRVKVRSRDIPF